MSHIACSYIPMLSENSLNLPPILGLSNSYKRLKRLSSIIERAPLQTYGAALVFRPKRNEIRTRHWKERLSFIKSVEGIREGWNPCLQTLEGHRDRVNAVAFSPDGKVIASAS